MVSERNCKSRTILIPFVQDPASDSQLDYYKQDDIVLESSRDLGMLLNATPAGSSQLITSESSRVVVVP